MKICLQILLLIFVIICITESKKKEKWTKKHKYDDVEGDMNKKEHKYDDLKGDIDKKDDSPKDVKYNSKKEKVGLFSKKKSKHYKKEKYGHKDHMSWLNIKKASDCGLECNDGEICISGPIDTKPLCVHKKDLKKSLKLFHKYQKKEMKAWKHFQKENYHHDSGEELYPPYKEGDSNKEDSYSAIKKKFLELDDKLEKKVDLTPYAPGKAEDPEAAHKENETTLECSTGQFSQMRTRLMGWFHLLHGQDHLARKAHEGNIKHFYKHISVKKELREHDGNKCECLKSAMWQFEQMDKNNDDHLSIPEIAEMEENSLEPCMKPYLTSCDYNADRKFSSHEWCCCFANVVAPCFKKVDEFRKSDEPVTYMPRCDKEGYFMREQCSGDSEEDYKCWCVDYNGNEYKGTFTHGRAHCSKIALYAIEKIPLA